MSQQREGRVDRFGQPAKLVRWDRAREAIRECSRHRSSELSIIYTLIGMTRTPHLCRENDRIAGTIEPDVCDLGIQLIDDFERKARVDSDIESDGDRLGFIATELSQLVIGEKLRKQITLYLKATIFGTLSASAAMKLFAFASHADGWMLYPAVLFGLAIPRLIYLFITIGASLYIDCHAKS